MKPTKEEIEKVHNALDALFNAMRDHDVTFEVEPKTIMDNPVLEIYVGGNLVYETCCLILDQTDLCDAMSLLYADVSDQLESHK